MSTTHEVSHEKDTGQPAPRSLVVDDDRFFRTVVGNVLLGAGFEVVYAASAEEAFARLAEEVLRLDVLVLDLHMPGMSGAQLVDRIRRLGGETDLAVVVLTGATLTEIDKEELAKIGADDILSKTESPEQILTRIRLAIDYKANVNKRAG